MRTIVTFLLASIVAVAQAPQEIERLEKVVAARPNDVPPRVQLLNALANRGVAIPPERVRELRRQHILWLIEHHPEAADIYATPQLLLPPKGRLADAAGSAEAVALWKELVARPDVKAEVVANAAIYLRAADPALARALLDAQAADPVLGRARGLVDGAIVVGMTGIGQNVQFSTNAALRESALAKAAREEIDASSDANLLGKAGVVLGSGQIELPGEVTFGDDDALALSERWLRKAYEIAPGDWKADLGRTLQTKANRTLDPKEKVRLLSEALGMVPDGAKPGILQNLMNAEFDAGDDAAAERDAGQLLATAPKNPNAYNAAQTILGRVAASKGEIEEAKTRLLASVKMPDAIRNANFQPDMTLAQDVYDAGGKDAVLQFLEASRKVWTFDRGRIDRMISFIKKAPSVDLVQLSRQFPGSEVLRRPAPEFAAKDREGKTWTRDQIAGKTVALEFGTAPLAEKIAGDKGVLMLRVEDPDTKRRFEVLTDPTVVVIDPKGNVSAFRSGPANEQEWRNEFDAGVGKGPNPSYLPAPTVLAAAKDYWPDGRVQLAWMPLEGAESYVVEWDYQDEKGWVFDREHTVNVVATRETSATVDLNGFTSVRWRVFGVPKNGSPGSASRWTPVGTLPVTKNYK
jgi:tetratricopeptide (TPR) repeat protein